MQHSGFVRTVRGWDALAVALAVVLTVLFAIQPDDDLPAGATARPFDGWAAVIVTGAIIVLIAGARRWPFTTFVVVLGLNGLWHELHYTNGIINGATMVAGFAVGVTGDRRRQVAAQAIATIPLLVVVLAVEHQPYSQVIDGIGWAAVSLLVGELVHSRRLLMDHYRRRAEHAEADREAEAQRRVADERLRIARDLHDLLAHTISIVMVQTNVATEALDRRPEQTRAALYTIRDAGKQATREVRATLALLRDDATAGAVSHSPAPRLDQLADLVAASSHRGLTVHTDLGDITDADVSPLTALTVYRVVQEALTNVARHADATTAWLTVSCNGTTIEATVRDDGDSTQPPTTEGHGLAGMRERVNVAGGTLRHGPATDGGFIVVASLPIHSEARR